MQEVQLKIKKKNATVCFPLMGLSGEVETYSTPPDKTIREKQTVVGFLNFNDFNF